MMQAIVSGFGRLFQQLLDRMLAKRGADSVNCIVPSSAAAATAAAAPRDVSDDEVAMRP